MADRDRLPALIEGPANRTHHGEARADTRVMRDRRRRHPTVRYHGRAKVIETTGQWGVYAGERIVLGDGRSLEDDLGMRLRKAFQPGAAAALESGAPLPESFDLGEVEITIRLRRRPSPHVS
jgi:hypothetical protein